MSSSDSKLPEVDERLLRGLATSSCVRFGTEAPFALGRFFVKRIGFADIPVVGMVVTCKQRDVRALVPIVRSFVFAELEGAGISNEAVEFVPTVGQTERGSRQTRFVDANESSPTKGKNKIGQVHEFHFEIRKNHVNDFEWPRTGSYRQGKLPERKPRGEEAPQEE